MNKEKELIKRIAEIIDIKEENLSMEYKLDENIFDSLGILALSAAIDSVYDVVVPVKKLQSADKIADIFSFIHEALNE